MMNDDSKLSKTSDLLFQVNAQYIGDDLDLLLPIDETK
jgi:hypothetical protein